MKRREFIKSPVVLTAGAGLGATVSLPAAAEEAAVQRYTKLGKTDIEMSDISLRKPSMAFSLFHHCIAERQGDRRSC